MSAVCDLGVVGLATMGANLARNAARRGFSVAVYNRHRKRTDHFAATFGGEGRFTPAYALADFVASIARPRKIILVVEAGAGVDGVLDDLLPLLEQGDVVIDAGNSLFTDTERRALLAAKRDIHLLGMGMSGGEKGALEGPSLMPGGDEAAYRQVAPVLEAVAAVVDGSPCCDYIGPGGSGHYVKMVHNGIEYADMQALTEVYDQLRNSFGLSFDAIAPILASWRNGELDSFLLDTAVTVLGVSDESGAPLVDLVLDEAGQKGTGGWTTREAIGLGVAGSTTAAAVIARFVSARRDRRQIGAELFGGSGIGTRPLEARDIDDARDALLATRLVAFSQNFDQLAAASDRYGWNLDLQGIAGLWRGGCIIRGRVLEHIVAALDRRNLAAPLLFEPWFVQAILKAEPGWRRFVAQSTIDEVPIPVIGSALSYFDGLRHSRSPAGLIQAMRDAFGAHGYRRVDRDGDFHTEWGVREAVTQ